MRLEKVAIFMGISFKFVVGFFDEWEYFFDCKIELNCGLCKWNVWLLKVFKLLYILRNKIRHLKSFNLFFPSCFSIKKFVRQLNFSLSREINKNSEKTTKRKNLISHLRNLKLDSRHFFPALSSCKLNFYLFRNFESLFFLSSTLAEHSQVQ